jgi:signal transduction histidine kinase
VSEEGGAPQAPGPHATLALVVAVVGLTGCAVAFAVSSQDKLNEPLVLVLALCVVASSFVSLDIEGSLFWGGAAIPHVCAFALLGPAPAAVITAVEEVSVWVVDRYRLRMFPINLFATLAPNMLAAKVMQTELGAGVGYYIVLAAVAGGVIALNFLIVTGLVGLFYGQRIVDRLLRHRRLAGPLAVNIAVAVAAVALYRATGIGATLFVLAGVLIFAYVMKRLALEREHLARISELATSRGQLVAQLLEAEDRERRALAHMLHDDVIQSLLVARQDLLAIQHVDAERAVRRIDESLQSLRRAIRATHPSIFERVGLATALATVGELYASHGGFEVCITVDAIEAGPHDRLMFSAARELLANTAKHAAARNVHVTVSSDGHWTALRVKDDGRGFDPRDAPQGLVEGHIGLHSLKERVTAVGGTFEIGTGVDGGTRVTVRLPTLGLPVDIPIAAQSLRELASIREH